MTMVTFQDMIKKLNDFWANEGCLLTVDLPRQNVTTPEGKKFSFDIDTFSKNCLLKGLDDVGWTLQFGEKIQRYEQQVRIEKPWLFISR